MKTIYSLIFICLSVVVFAQQKPYISNLDKTSGAPGETLIISGTGFNAGNMQVNFGAGVATIINSTSTTIEVTIPTSATYGPVTVLDKSSGKSGISLQNFSPKFYGDGFDAAAMAAPNNIATGSQYSYDLCACDLDLDGLVDVAIANNTATNINVLRNKSNKTAISFDNISIPNLVSTISTECGDLNGDGKPDLVFTTEVSTNVDHVFIYRNESTPGTISFSSQKFAFPNAANGDKRIPRRFKIADLDGDGLNDLIMGNEHDNVLFIYRNLTTTIGGTIVLDSPKEFIVTGTINTGSVDVKDFNNDGFPDIVVLAPNKPSQFIYLVQNLSKSGTISLKNIGNIGGSEERINVTTADLDLDGFNEIITTNSNSNRVSVFKNTTTAGGDITFNSSGQNFTVTAPWGLSTSDMDGDGLTDILLASTSNLIVVLENNSSSSGINFLTQKTISTSRNNRNVESFDVNGDGKPDLVTTNNSLQTSLGNMTVVLNKNCVKPTIVPDNITFCTGSPFDLNATKAEGSTFTWSIESGSATIHNNGTDKTSITVNSGTSVTVKVTVTSPDGSCSSFDTKTYTLTGGTPPVTPTINPSKAGVICAGTNFSLSGPTGFDQYLWTLPDGTETSQSTNTLSISSPSAMEGGIYKLRIQNNGSCYSAPGELKVEISEPPVVVIENLGEDVFCETQTVNLTVPPITGFSYQWNLNGSPINGQSGNSYTASASGDYTITVTSIASGCKNEGPKRTLKAVPIPESNFTSVAEICRGVATSFNATSTGESGFGLNYLWSFGDNNSGTGSAISHTYNSANTFSVKLTTSYANLSGCSADKTGSIKVSAPPSLTISTPEGTEKCPSDSIRLEVTQGQKSYKWSNGSTTYFTYGKTEENSDFKILNVDMETTIGCKVSASQTISNFSNSRIHIASEDSEAKVINDTIKLEMNVATVWLRGINGASYTWTPADILDATTGEFVKAYPKKQFTTITVEGNDAINGCESEASIVLETPGVIPRKSFSPNGDNLGFDCWEILNTDNLDGCTVYIFDQRGSKLLEVDSPFENNCVWNGNVNNSGTPAPEGVYYFVMKCDNSTYNRSGTILLGR